MGQPVRDRPGTGLRRVGAVLLWVGVVLLLVSVAVAAVAGAATYRAGRTLATEHVPMPDGRATVQLEAGQAKDVFARIPAGAEPEVVCEVTGPDGTEVAVTTRGRDLQLGSRQEHLAGVGRFEATTGGAHAVECSGAETVLSDPVELGALAVPVVGVVGGVLAATGSLFLACLGAVLWLVGRGQARRAARPVPSGTPYRWQDRPADDEPGGRGFPPPPPPRDGA